MGRGRVKRQQVAVEDGWTVITHGMGGISLDEKEKGGRTGNKNKSKSSVDAISTLPDIVQGLTPEKLLSEFKMLQERWDDTLLARQIDGIFCKRRDSNENRDGDAGTKGEQVRNVTEAVCIGIGSFSRDWAHRWRSMWQLVLFVEVVRKRTLSFPSLYMYIYRVRN